MVGGKWAVIVNYGKALVKLVSCLPRRLKEGWEVLDKSMTKSDAAVLAKAMHPTLKLVKDE